MNGWMEEEKEEEYVSKEGRDEAAAKMAYAS